MAGTRNVQDLVAWLDRFRTQVAAEKDHLTELDSAIGDADHGTNMDRGMAAVMVALEATPPSDVAGFGKTVGMALVSNVGGASGPLFGTFFLRLGAAGGTAIELDGAGLAAALRAGMDGIIARGKAEPGDKTMIDAFIPALTALDEALAGGADLEAALAAASSAAAAGRDATIPLVARKGRASYLGERSAGHMDPGSATAALLFEALAA